MATAKNYAAIAASKIRKAGEPVRNTRPPRFLVYSRNKKGKTRMSATAPHVLILDPEHGTDRYERIFKRDGVDTWPIDKWEDMDDVVKFLRLGKHSYDWVGVDGLTKITNMSLRWVMNQAAERDLDRKPEQVDKRDYGRSGKMMESMLWQLDALPMGIVYTAQERMIEAGDSGDDDEESESAVAQFVPDLPKGVRREINSMVDVIGRLYTVKTTVKVRKGGPSAPITEEQRVQRRLWLEPHPAYDTGYRSEFVLPSHLKNPTVPTLVRAIEEGTTK